MLMGMGTMVSAAEKESSIPEYSETNDGGMTVNIAGNQEGTIVEGSGNEEGINPLWWPGDGQHSGGQRDVPDRCKQRFGGSRNGGSD